MSIYTTKKDWQFFVEDEHGKRKILLKKKLKYPELSKFWITMQRYLSENPFADFKIHAIGYELIENKLK